MGDNFCVPFIAIGTFGIGINPLTYFLERKSNSIQSFTLLSLLLHHRLLTFDVHGGRQLLKTNGNVQ